MTFKRDQISGVDNEQGSAISRRCPVMETLEALVTVLAADHAAFLTARGREIFAAISARGGRIVRADSAVLIAVFSSSPDNCRAAIDAAIVIRRQATLSAETRSLRIGIATGVVTLGFDDSGLQTAEGTPVDVALRLREALRGGGVAVDEETFENVRGEFQFRSEPGITAKGKSRELGVHELVEDAPPTALNQKYGSMLSAMRGANHSDSPLRVGESHAAYERSGSVTPPIGADFQRILVRSTTVEPEAGDTVDCTIFAPPSAPIGESCLVQVFVHLPASAEEAARLATEFDSSSSRRGYRALESKVERGARLGFELAMPGLQVDDPFQSFVWNGRPEAVQFGVTAPRNSAPRVVIGTVTVSQNAVPVGHLKFRLQLVAREASEQSAHAAPAGDSARRYSRAFISYASRDRDKVLSRVQMLKPLGIQFFQDVLDLEPGDRWEKQLYRHIDECDLFLLFWSSAARESTWVMKEVNYALKRKQNDEFASPEIHPVIIEGPPVPAPPPELSHLHFNDRVIYFIANAG